MDMTALINHIFIQNNHLQAGRYTAKVFAASVLCTQMVNTIRRLSPNYIKKGPIQLIMHDLQWLGSTTNQQEDDDQRPARLAATCD